MAEQYFVILGSEDGGCYVQKMTKEQILAGLEQEPHEPVSCTRSFGRRKFLKELPDDICNFTDAVIIKGNIIVPVPVQLVTKFEI